MTDPACTPVSSALVAYLQLVRAANLPTAVADVTMGYLLVHRGLAPAPVYGCLLASSCLFYMSGMVLNDVFDLPDDSIQRPERPLPSGRIAVARARRLAIAMLLGGIGFGWLAGFLGVGESVVRWRSGVVATLLAGTIVLYDGAWKATWAGPVAMGACRMLNVLLGMSVAGPQDANLPQWFGYDAAQLLIGGGIGVYIAGVTIFARRETAVGHRGRLGLATGVMVAGLSLLAAFPNFGAFGSGVARLTVPSTTVWALLVVLLGFSIVRRCAMAVVDPRPARVQVAVKQCILSLIVLDAAVCLAVCSPVWWSVGILALMIPSLWLGRWAYST